MTTSKVIDSELQDSTTTLPRVLLVEAEVSGQSGLHTALQRSGFAVVSTSTVKEALILLTAGDFAALVCDLQIPAAGDGFTLVNAMRHFHPSAITMIMSKYPALKESVSSLLPQADEILVTPIPPHEIVTLLKNRLQQPKRPQL